MCRFFDFVEARFRHKLGEPAIKVIGNLFQPAHIGDDEACRM